MKALIVGQGQIGIELARLLELKNATSAFFRHSDDQGAFQEMTAQSDIVFLAISTKDKGDAAYSYIIRSHELGKPVVTCEKGALSYHFEALAPCLDRIGFSATVFGASGLLNRIRIPQSGIQRISAVLNGTLNFLMSRPPRNYRKESLLRKVKKLGLCEPGSEDLLQLFLGELRDAMMKSAILGNLFALKGKFITPDDFSHSLPYESEVLAMIRKGTHRLIVKIGDRQSLSKPELPGFWADCEPWRIAGEFTNAYHQEFGRSTPRRAQNAICVVGLNSEKQIVRGLGAGIVPTAQTMIEDAFRLLRREKM